MTLIFAHGRAKSAFMARAWSGGIWIGSWASRRTASLSSVVSALISHLICVAVSPPLMQARSAVRVRVLWDTVLEQAWALRTRHPLTGNRDRGYV